MTLAWEDHVSVFMFAKNVQMPDDEFINYIL